jgi:hypothetical protein
VSTTILESGEASLRPEMISWAVLGCMSSSVTITSGFVLATCSAAPTLVEDVPTTAIYSWEARTASRPRLNMVWSSARCTRVVICSPSA